MWDALAINAARVVGTVGIILALLVMRNAPAVNAAHTIGAVGVDLALLVRRHALTVHAAHAIGALAVVDAGLDLVAWAGVLDVHAGGIGHALVGVGLSIAAADGVEDSRADLRSHAAGAFGVAIADGLRAEIGGTRTLAVVMAGQRRMFTFARAV